MYDENKIKALRDLIHSAQNSINSAKKLLNTLIGDDFSEQDEMSGASSDASIYTSGELTIVE